jgi:hypothetical protein
LHNASGRQQSGILRLQAVARCKQQGALPYVSAAATNILTAADRLIHR